MLSFTAVDFETANGSRASVCAAGVAKVVDGQVVRTQRFLVKPPPGFDDFAAGNMRVHGITGRDVADAPPWPVVYREIMAIAAGDALLAHNMPFDMSVMRNACDAYDLPWPTGRAFCTLRMSRRLLPLTMYQLPFVLGALGMGQLADHHDPVADAVAAATVAIELGHANGATTLTDLDGLAPFWDSLGGDIGTAVTAPVGNVLDSEAVCFTGQLMTMTRSAAQDLVRSRGGEVHKTSTKKTTLLVTGDFDPTTLRPGANMSSKLERAVQLRAGGQKIEILTEDEFLSLVAISDEELRLRIAAKRSGSSRCPEHVITQARITVPGEGYWQWFRRSLAHPEGRAVGGELCVWCGDEVVRKGTHWIYLDRHVCSGGCNASLKGSAKRQWSNNGTFGPEVDTSDEWGTWVWQGGQLVLQA